MKTDQVLRLQKKFLNVKVYQYNGFCKLQLKVTGNYYLIYNPKKLIIKVSRFTWLQFCCRI